MTGFDELVEQLESRLMPRLEAAGQELRSLWPSFDIATFSQRHADTVHTLGLWCALPGHRLLEEDNSRGININIFHVEDYTVRGFVAWNSKLRCEGGAVRQSYELMTRCYTSPRPGDLLAFIEETPLLLMGFGGPVEAKAHKKVAGRPPKSPSKMQGWKM